MFKHLIIASLLLFPTWSYASDKVIAGLDVEKDLPVLNDELRKIDTEARGLDTRIDTLEAAPALATATQAEMETASSTTVYVAPGRVHNHPGVAKVWAIFDGTTVGTHAVTAGYNVTSVTRNGTGDYTVTIATDFSSADYAVFVSGHVNSGSCVGRLAASAGTPLAAGTANIITVDDGGGAVDAQIVCVSMFGDQ